jgi:hypothetical protein
MNDTICEAIAARARMRISYGGGRRLIEPHCHGMSTAGKDVLRAYQVSGFSRSGEHEGWKLFDVSKIQSMEVLTERFLTNRPGHDNADRQMSTVYCHV